LLSMAISSKREELIRNLKRKLKLLNAISESHSNLLLMKYPALFRENTHTPPQISKILEIFSLSKSMKPNTITLLKKKFQSFG